MRDLIERLERATGPEFALDCAIFETVLPEEWFGSKVISWFSHGGKYGCNTEDGYRHLECLTAPAYTASLDAALTLVPEGLYFLLSRGRITPEEPLYATQVLMGNGENHYVIGEAESAANLPIALCIAALKAREAAK